MADLLIFQGARQFFSYMDEENFFTWLKKIPAIQDIRGTARGLELTITKPMDRHSLADLIAALMRYSIDMKCLRDLSRPEDEAWFKDPQKYWHKAVFLS